MRSTFFGAATLLLALAGTTKAQTLSTTQVVGESREAGALVSLGDIYLHHFFHRNVDELRNFWTDETVVRDLAFGLEIVGADSLSTQIPAAWEGVSVDETRVIGRIGSLNGVVTYHGEAAGTIQFGDRMMRFEVPYMQVLVFDGEKVVSHDNFFHYPCLNRQALLQADGPIESRLLPTCQE